ncbi:MAG TPA: FAD-dependent thymidylate synthase [Candidatus Binatia bacterium]|nr:FAD-dependent thymidylate synthase [Candidatus Binatia bacterium]
MPDPRDHYHVEAFETGERDRLRPWVSNLESPVFVLRGLPQVTAAALFARYSRSRKSLRRLLLDEFLEADGGVVPPPDGAGRARAGRLFGRVLAEYGDDSVAQLGGVHLACEQVSQPLAKAIEWGRLAAYLEQSTRYIAYDDRRDGEYRYLREPALMASRHGETYRGAMDRLFDTYAELLPVLRDHLDRALPHEADARARSRAIRALALDLLRGLLPAGTVSNVGVFASPQSLEQLVMRLRAHPLPEARAYAELVDRELQVEIPDFLSRLDRADRGGVWVDYLRETAEGLRSEAERLDLRARGGRPRSPAVQPGRPVSLVRWDADGEARIIAAALMPHASLPLAELDARVAALSGEERDRLFEAAVGIRGNRRHRPGRGFEHADYTFELVSDYGAFRDLQRHRLLTVQWQDLTPELGYEVPEQVIAAGHEGSWRGAVEAAEEAFEAIQPEFPQQAQYLVTLGHRLRYLLKLNAREALHLIELRTSPQGHPSYRRICQEMLAQIDTVAGHHRVARAMRFAGSEDVHLPRYAAEAARAE